MPDPSQVPAESLLAEAFQLPDAATMSVRTLEATSMAITEICNDRLGFGVTDPMPYTDAAMLAVQLRPIPFHEAMSDGKAVPVYDIQAGDTLFYDMRRDPRANVMTPSHSLHFVLPQTLFDEIASEIESHTINGLFPPTGAIVRDRELVRLARTILPSLHRPDEASAIFTSHFALALGMYASWRYGGMEAPRQPDGELCGLQTRLATEFIAANLDGGFELKQLAALCGMQTRRFVVAFRETYGMAPYQWLAIRRLDLARSLLCRKRHDLSEIASLCGFADEAHFTQTFARATGVAPLDWQLQLQ